MTIKATTTDGALYVVVRGEESLKNFRELCQRAGNCWWENAPAEIREFMDVVKPVVPVAPIEPVYHYAPGCLQPDTSGAYMRRRMRKDDGALVEFVSNWYDGRWFTRSGILSPSQELEWRLLTPAESEQLMSPQLKV